MYAKGTKEEVQRQMQGNKAGLETMLARFNKEVQAYGLMRELKKRQYYEKPSSARNRRKREALLRKRKGNV